MITRLIIVLDLEHNETSTIDEINEGIREILEEESGSPPDDFGIFHSNVVRIRSENLG